MAAPARRVLQAIADTAEPMTVTELTALLGGHPNSTRSHLATLVAGGLATSTPLPVAGRGRPASGYTATPRGRSLLTSADAPTADLLGQDYLGLTSALATHLRSRGPKPQREARAVGQIWGKALAAQEITAQAGTRQTERPQARTDGAGPGSARRRTIRLLDRLGFSPLAAKDTVALRTCPLLEAARADPGVVCEIHLGLVTGALATFGGSDRGARLVPFAEPGACRLIWRT